MQTTVNYKKADFKNDLKKAIKQYGEMIAFYDRVSRNPYIKPESTEDFLEEKKVQLQRIHNMIDSL